MFNFDEKKFLNPEPSGMFPEDRTYTHLEDVEHIKAELHHMCDRLLRFEKEINEKCNDLLTHLSTDNSIFKTTFVESFRQFMEEVKVEINNFETNVDNTITLFQRTTETRLELIEERLARLES
ncbi:MAG: hypothetical protein J6S23_01240 [Clostridia bacterium]|nr:hypothetical protein [Clostridia bacterium]